MTDEQLQAIKDRLAATTPEPLVLSRYTHGGGRLWCESPRKLIADFYQEGDREFYGNAREHMQLLVDEVERLRAENKRLSKALREIMLRGDSMDGTPMGTQRQERNIWRSMREIAVTALQAKFPALGA